MMGKDGLSTREAAQLAGVDASYIRRLVAQERIKGQRLGGRYWIIDRADLERWMQEREKR